MSGRIVTSGDAQTGPHVEVSSTTSSYVRFPPRRTGPQDDVVSTTSSYQRFPPRRTTAADDYVEVSSTISSSFPRFPSRRYGDDCTSNIPAPPTLPCQQRPQRSMMRRAFESCVNVERSGEYDDEAQLVVRHQRNGSVKYHIVDGQGKCILTPPGRSRNSACNIL